MKSSPVFKFVALFFGLLSVISSSAQQNIALGKTAVASSMEWAGNNPYLAIDGRGNTNTNGTGGCSGDCSRWASGFNDNQWIYIDLSASYHLTEVKLYWENASGRNFEIQVSNDAVSWTTIHTLVNNSTYINSFDMTGLTTRYVRMNGQTRNTGYGFSLYEFEVYGTKQAPLGNNIALNTVATASGFQHGGVLPSYATDGQGSNSQVNYFGGCSGTCTQWSSESNDAAWLQVDLGMVTPLTQVVLYWEGNNYARSFEIQVSNNASSWTTVASLSDNYGAVNTLNLAGQSARYVRMQGVQRNSGIYALYEMEVFQVPGVLPVELLSFSAKLSGTSTAINWKAEIDHPTQFWIERSNNGTDFSTIGTQQATPGNSTLEFNFTDKFPAAGKNYYRLRYAETGGKPAYSTTVVLTTDLGKEMSVYPNPVTTSTFQLNLGAPANGALGISIFNNAGMLVQQQKIQSTGQQVLSISRKADMAPGIYTIQVSTGSTVKRTRLVIAK